MKNTQQTLTKVILKNALQHKIGLSEKNAEIIYTGIIEALTSMFQENDVVKIVDFGTFAIHNKEPRIGRNPKTKEEFIIGSRRSIRFRPSKKLRSDVSKVQVPTIKTTTA